MTGGRGIDVVRSIFRFRRIGGPAVVALSAVLLLAVSSAVRTAALERYGSVRKEHLASLERLSAGKKLAAREGEIRKAVDSLRKRTGRKEALREVFEPFVASGGGVETGEVSYEVLKAGRGLESYRIRFSASGRYPDLARFLARVEEGAPLAVVESVDFARGGDRPGVRAKISVRVPVR